MHAAADPLGLLVDNGTDVVVCHTHYADWQAMYAAFPHYSYIKLMDV